LTVVGQSTSSMRLKKTEHLSHSCTATAMHPPNGITTT